MDRLARKHVCEPICRIMFLVGMKSDLQCLVAYDLGGQPWRLMVMNMTLMSYCYAVQIFLSCRTGRLFWMHHIKDHLVDKKGQPINVLKPKVIFKRWTENDLCRYSYSSCDSWDSLNLMRGIQKHLIRESDAKELDSCPSEGPLDDGACK
ncbi:hypothetical protein CSPAE12_05156 [Colletotrichum incanum]|nr:hypothetical protein CSPAE12_05156 [Colletotrichum incanum]